VSPLWTPASRSSFRVHNWGANPSDTPGTSVVPGASNAEGSWTQVLAALAQECHALYLRVSGGATAANAKNHLLDIGIDPAGGSSYTAILNNLVCGGSGPINNTGSGHRFFFPLRLPSGATVAARIQGSNATAGTVLVGVRAYGQPDMPWLFPVGQYSETIGTITASNGVSFTPGNAADGTWASLGATTRELWWWQIGYQIDNGTVTVEQTYVEIGYGDASNKHVIASRLHRGTTGEELGTPLEEDLLWPAAYCRVPAGSNMYLRGRCNGAPDTGYNGVAVGIGG
jgi:hypothetical protein